MKKKIFVLTLVVVMMASLAGCGSRTKATDITIEDGDTIIVDVEDTETETDIPVEETESTEEITETEVIGNNSEVTEFVGAEDENIVLYAEMGDRNTDFYGLTYTENPTKLFADTDIPVYCENGNEVGYIKAGATVTVEENANERAWSRFTNPISGTDYDYLYVMSDYLFAMNNIKVSAEMLKEDIITEISNRNYDFTVLDVPESDMEVYEFRMNAVYMYDISYKYDISFYCHYNNFNIGNYITYAVETFEDGNDVVCKLYYKYTFEEWLETHPQ